MMKPEEAYKRLIESGPFDDPTVSWHSHRWYWHSGVLRERFLAVVSWGGIPSIYTQFRHPENRILKPKN
jgi:hypothetical protein